MTPTDVMALVGLWRRQSREGEYLIRAEDVSIEVSSMTGETYGRTRAQNALRRLVEQKKAKEKAWDSFLLTKAGENFCIALQKMGLCEF